MSASKLACIHRRPETRLVWHPGQKWTELISELRQSIIYNQPVPIIATALHFFALVKDPLDQVCSKITDGTYFTARVVGTDPLKPI